ncbi:MAG TPA: type II secretion system protein [Rubrivivax sp.]|nr:type II secretion system protein [Rubrivivax sp.]
MRAKSSRARGRGFTTVELVAVIVLMGVLAVVALPRIEGALAQRGDHWRDQVLAALRHAQATAQSHRRLVCATVGTGAVTLSIATANPATACASALPGPGGSADYASDSRGFATSVSPAGPLYFQPNGRVTTDGAGSTATDRSITVSGQEAISVVAETGLVR